MARWSEPPSWAVAATSICPPIRTAFRQFLMTIGPTAPVDDSWMVTSPPPASTVLRTPAPLTFLTGKLAWPAGGAQLRAPEAPDLLVAGSAALGDVGDGPVAGAASAVEAL